MEAKKVAIKALIGTAVTVLTLIVGGLGFIYLSPDYDIYFVRSGSMKPAINMGDVVIVGPASVTGGIKPGNIVIYELGKNLITHRVFSVDGDTLITKGDANEDPDPRPVLLSQVKGCYLFKVPYIGYVTSFTRTRLGWFLAIILPAMVLVGFIARDIVKEALKNEDQVKNVVKTGKPIKNFAGNNDPLKDVIREALKGYDFPEARVALKKTKQNIT